jgi:hypothetical protein
MKQGSQASHREESAAIPADTAKALGRAMAAQQNSNQALGNARAQKTDASSNASTVIKSVWQHPFVDVFKHFKVLPVADWKLNQKHGNVTEAFAKEIGRKVMCISGSISANNFI